MSPGCSSCRSGSATRRASKSFSPGCPPKAITPRPTTKRSCRPSRCSRTARQDLLVRIVATPRLDSAPAAIWCDAAWRADGHHGELGADRCGFDRGLAGRPDEAGGGRHLGAANACDAQLRCRSSDGDKPDQCRTCRKCDRARAGLAETYKPDDVLVPAARTFAKSMQSTAWPAVGRLREAALEHLRRRIDLPLEPPRTGPGRTRSSVHAPTAALGAFLLAPDQREWRLPAIQNRRTHVEQSVRSATCDLSLATEKRGSPHTLVAIKNQATYERRAKQRRQDLEHVAALGG